MAESYRPCDDEIKRTYGLKCSKVCSAFPPDALGGELYNCIDHLLECHECKLVFFREPQVSRCVCCAVELDACYVQVIDNGHIGSGFGLCPKCYKKLIIKNTTINDKIKKTMQSNIDALIKTLSRKEE